MAARWLRPLRFGGASHSALAQKGSGPHRGRTLFTRRSVRRIFRHVQEVNCPGGARETTLGCAAAKNDPASFRRSRRKPGRGPGPFLEFPEDGGPHSAAFSYRWPLLSAWPPSGFGGELRPKVVDETSLTPRRARRPGVPPPVPTSPAKRAASPPPWPVGQPPALPGREKTALPPSAEERFFHIIRVPSAGSSGSGPRGSAAAPL